VPPCSDERRVRRAAVDHSCRPFGLRSWLVLCAEFIYVLNLFKIPHLCTVFILSVQEKLHVTNVVIDKHVPPQKKKKLMYLVLHCQLEIRERVAGK
jgi:hypothetical protein